MLEALKVIATVLNLAYMIIIFLFCRGLSWERKQERASIIGFTSMMAVYVLNIMVFWMIGVIEHG